MAPKRTSSGATARPLSCVDSIVGIGSATVIGNFPQQEILLSVKVALGKRDVLTADSVWTARKGRIVAIDVDDGTLAPLGRRPATIYDIAHEAGVSAQSVSRFMRGFAQRSGTRAKIERALESLEYKPNLTARSLVTGRSHRLGALTHEINQVGPSQVLQGASAAARDAGYLLDIVALDMGNIDEITRALEMLQQHELAGVVALASTDQMRSAIAQVNVEVPVLLFSEQDEDDSAGSWLNGIPLAMEHLVDLGHRRIAHIAGPVTWSAARNRLHAYEHALSAHGLGPGLVVEGDWSAESGYRATRTLLEGEVPTAIAAANDQMALGAMLALAEAGLSVPGDVSVTGLDDTPEAAFFSPPLTTVRVDFRAEGRRAVNDLLTRVNAEETVDSTPFPLELIARRSSAPPADSRVRT